MMRLEPIPSYRAEAVWPSIQHWIDELNDRFPPGWQMANPMEACRARDAQLWLIRDDSATLGVLVTQITTDVARIAEVMIIAGDNMSEWLHLVNDLESWARAEGCVAIAGAVARDGWVRVLKDYGWRKRAVVIERRL